jgi:hypothetical protein
MQALNYVSHGSTMEMKQFYSETVDIMTKHFENHKKLLIGFSWLDIKNASAST